MLKILSAEQIKALDAYTIKNEPIASIDLMERACQAFVNRFIEIVEQSRIITIVCGTGNNGGDGLGVARLLYEKRFQVNVWIVRGAASESEDFTVNLNRLPKEIPVKEILNESDLDALEESKIIIDALFGSGLSKPIEGLHASVINYLNTLNAYRIAIDIPSGVFADKPSIKGAKFKADLTLSFQLPKLVFLLPDHAEEIGVWELLDIGLSKQFIEQIDAEFFFTEFEEIKSIAKPRVQFSHKGNYGKALLVSGSYGKMGATVLAAKAAMRSGLGLLTAHVPSSGYTVLQTAVPECMLFTDEHAAHTTKINLKDSFDVIGVGPGLGTQRETGAALHHLMSEYHKPMVIDADALNILAENRALIFTVPQGSILTPHPKEFERIVGQAENGFERLEKLKELAKKINGVVLLKGAFTAIASPDGKIYFNSSGNPGMATAGSGDVLTGILTAQLAKGLSALDAARLGVYLHGLAADIAVEQLGEEALIASDIIDFLPDAWMDLS